MSRTICCCCRCHRAGPFPPGTVRTTLLWATVPPKAVPWPPLGPKYFCQTNAIAVPIERRTVVVSVVFCVLVFSCGQTVFCPCHICPTNTTHLFLSDCLSGGCVWWEPLATSNTSTLWQSLHPDFDDTTLPMVFNAATFGKNLATAAYSLRSSTSCSACSENKVVSIQGGKELWPLLQVGLFDLYEC